jgi:negative regulator of sigma E activity
MVVVGFVRNLDLVAAAACVVVVVTYLVVSSRRNPVHYGQRGRMEV